MLDFRAHLRLRAILRALHFIHPILITVALAGEILCLRRALLQHAALSAIRLIAPPRVSSVSSRSGSIRESATFAGVCHQRMNQLTLAIHAHVRLHPEVPLLPLARLVHLRITLLLAVLRRTRGVHDRRIHLSFPCRCATPALVSAPAPARRCAVPTDAPPLSAGLADRRLIRRRLPPQIDVHKATQRHRFIQRLFHCRVR